jgi:V8-like Glu-specific endopeptidase
MLARSCGAALLLASLALAQQSVYPVRSTALAYDSGALDNPAAVERVVWSQDVAVPGDWLQLHFGACVLAAGSRLSIRPLARPDWVQWHDAGSLADYRGWSCQFSGPTLRVELLAAPGSTGNRARLDTVVALDVGSAIEDDTICGTTDDRVLGSDPRQCRLDAGCTAWLFSEYAVGTAGHCMSTTAGHILHFNVPLSTASGTPQPAHPNDQYAMDAFHPFLNNGVGNDWSVSAALRNSNTRLYPGVAQGSWYTVVPAPGFVATQVIRITGYGSGNGTSGSATWNLVQKTHTGLRQSTTTATALRYGVDTTGGNSGSPVIFEATGQVVGVHTHGGCTSTSGGNSGTDAVRSDWTTARQQALALHVPGAVTPFGAGCPGGPGVPLLQLVGFPEIGQNVSALVTGLTQSSSAGLLVGGSSSTSWNGSPLPLDLASGGMAGCSLFVAFDFSDVVLTALGTGGRAYLLPNDQALVGVHVYLQYFGLDAAAPNPMGVAGTNAIDVLLGS